jgi:hypothetical protein
VLPALLASSALPAELTLAVPMLAVPVMSALPMLSVLPVMAVLPVLPVLPVVAVLAWLEQLQPTELDLEEIGTLQERSQHRCAQKYLSSLRLSLQRLASILLWVELGHCSGALQSCDGCADTQH